MDDDAALLGDGAVERALTVLDSDRAGRRGRVRAVRSRRHDVGRRDAAEPQPRACYVPSFIGFAHLLRRDVFMAVGGYRESFVFYGEEKDFCLRLIDAGYRTVYLPDALVIHAAGLRRAAASSATCATSRGTTASHALYNEPLGRLALAAAGAAGTLLPHAPRVEDRRPLGLGLDRCASCADNAGSVYRDRKPGLARDRRDMEALRQTPEPGSLKSESLNAET